MSSPGKNVNVSTSDTCGYMCDMHVHTYRLSSAVASALPVSTAARFSVLSPATSSAPRLEAAKPANQRNRRIKASRLR